jgi:hypothetical protein
MKPYRKRLLIPIDTSNEKVMMFNKSNVLVTVGYQRVVIGKRGPYVEFTIDQIRWDKFYTPIDQRYRQDSGVVYYEEFRSTDESFIKLYLQKRTVAYADYKVGLCYISPFDLYLSTGQRVITD